MRHVFILNPQAGKVDSTPELKAQIDALFAQSGEDYHIVVTQYAGHAEEIAQSYAQDGVETTLYACGGDGTLGEVAQVLPGHSQLILAPIPAGTGNDFVRSFPSMHGAQSHFSLSSLVNGTVVPFDLLLAGGRVSLNIVSVGLDAAIAENMIRFKRLPIIRGETAYNLSIIYSFFTSVRYQCQFEVDGKQQPEGDCVFAVAANGRYYGGGFMAAPLANWQDGLIDFIRVPAMPRWRLLPMIGDYKRGKHLKKYDFVKFARCKTMRILSNKPVALNCDGEIMSVMNPHIEVLPAAGRLLVPVAPITSNAVSAKKGSALAHI